MDVSFIMSADEIYTLMSIFPDHTEAGKLFAQEALPGAEFCDIAGLVQKKLAKKHANGQTELSPVISMCMQALAQADSAERQGDCWLIHSPWITLCCEAYTFNDKHYRITPMKDSNRGQGPGDRGQRTEDT